MTVTANGIDDSLAIYVFNSANPSGVSLACGGNGSLIRDVAPYLRAGEPNTIVLAHADLNCATSSLGTVDITSGGRALDIARE